MKMGTARRGTRINSSSSIRAERFVPYIVLPVGGADIETAPWEGLVNLKV